MKQGVGEFFTYNIIIIFLLIVFALLAATINYYKAYKVNSRILASIEKFEGYNALAVDEIRKDLNTLGYTKKGTSGFVCDKNRGKGVLVSHDNGNVNQNTEHIYCVYYFVDDRGKKESSKTNKEGEPIYYNYSAVSYIIIDLPVMGELRIPVHTKGERTFNFSNESSVG